MKKRVAFKIMSRAPEVRWRHGTLMAAINKKAHVNMRIRRNRKKRLSAWLGEGVRAVIGEHIEYRIWGNPVPSYMSNTKVAT